MKRLAARAVQMRNDLFPCKVVYRGATFLANCSGFRNAKKLQEAGWTLFFMAGEIKVTVLGSGKETLRRALKRLIIKVKAQQCNGMEIVQVTESSFLGVPYASISVHPRHLQKGLVFSGRP